MKNPCMTCYEEGATKACTKCSARRYCSKICQQKDWKDGHKHYCGNAGELDKDFEIKDSPDKIGVGLFAKRRFVEGDIIVAETPVFTSSRLEESHQIPHDLMHILDSMHPTTPFDSDATVESRIRRKIDINNIGHREKACLCVLMARINHDCRGNAIILPSVKSDAMLLRCTEDIRPGDEVTRCYMQTAAPVEFGNHSGWKRILRGVYFFNCKCSICRDDNKIATLNKAVGMLRESETRYAARNFKGAEIAQKVALELMMELRLGGPQYILTIYNELSLLTRGKICLDEGGKVFHELAAMGLLYVEDAKLDSTTDDLRKVSIIMNLHDITTGAEIQRKEDASRLSSKREGGSKMFGREPLCGFCYKTDPSVACSGCPRQYCDFSCQLSDWEEKDHKIWCGQTGVLGVDFTVGDSRDKEGVGLFANIEFKRGQTVFVEAPAIVVFSMAKSLKITHDYDYICQSLHPVGGGHISKLANNGISYDEDRTGIFPIAARLNHDCLGNVESVLSGSGKVLIFRCVRDIFAGDEITRPYVQMAYSPYSGGETTAERQLYLKKNFGFICKCLACTDEKVAKQLDEKCALENKFLDQRNGDADRAKRLARKLLSLFDQLGEPQRSYMLVYALLFEQQIRRSHRVTEEGLKYAKDALKYASQWYDEDHDAVAQWKNIVENPRSLTRKKCRDFSVCILGCGGDPLGDGYVIFDE